MSPSLARILLIAALTAGQSAAQIRWATSLDEAQATARSEGRPLVVVTHLTNARGSLQMTTDHFKDRALGKLAAETRNVFLDLRFESAGRRPPRRRGPSLPKSLPAIDRVAIEALLEVPDGRFLHAPQYIFLDPDGKVIVSVVGRVTAGELEWMWHEALRKILPQWSHSLTEAARAPRALKFGEATTWDGASPPPNDEEVAETLAELKKARSFRGSNMLKLAGLLRTHDKKAMSYVGANLRGRSWARPMALNAIAELSPRAWYDVVTPVLESSSETGRTLAAHALESLAHPKALSPLKKRWSNESSEEAQGALLRAMAASGPTDRKVTSLIDQALQRSKSEDLRAQAVLAIGLLDRRQPREQGLARALQDGSAKVRSAAAFTIAWRRDRALSSRLETAVATEADESVKQRFEAALDAVAGGSLDELEDYYRKELSGGRDLLKQLRGLGELMGGDRDRGGRGKKDEGKGGEPDKGSDPGKGDPNKGGDPGKGDPTKGDRGSRSGTP